MKNFRADISKNQFEFISLSPKLRLVGDYEIDTKLLALRLTGKGPFNFNVSKFCLRLILLSSCIYNVLDF